MSIVLGVLNRRDVKAAGKSATNAEVIAQRSAVAAEQSADAVLRPRPPSATEAARSNELAEQAERRRAAAAERERFVWSTDLIPKSSGHMKFVLHNGGTDTAEDVVLTLAAGIANPDFRDLPNGATILGPGSHEFYCDMGIAEVLRDRCF